MVISIFLGRIQIVSVTDELIPSSELVEYTFDITITFSGAGGSVQQMWRCTEGDSCVYYATPSASYVVQFIQPHPEEGNIGSTIIAIENLNLSGSISCSLSVTVTGIVE